MPATVVATGHNLAAASLDREKFPGVRKDGFGLPAPHTLGAGRANPLWTASDLHCHLIWLAESILVFFKKPERRLPDIHCGETGKIIVVDG
jgi:hypothetical protein